MPLQMERERNKEKFFKKKNHNINQYLCFEMVFVLKTTYPTALMMPPISPFNIFFPLWIENRKEN